MRVLITGAGGFLAGHLSSHLQRIDGIEVRGLRRAECDLSKDREELRAVLRSARPAVIFHLAGRISGSEAELDRDNRLATVNLLDAVREECSAAKIVLGSTVAVYGDGGTAAAPIDEFLTPRPRGFYGASKYAAERAALSHAEAGGPVITARMSNPVGSNMDASLLCGTLGKQIVEIEGGKASIITLRDLAPKRDFISANDCARALWRLAERGECGATYNVACGTSISIAEIVEIYLSLARVRPIEVRVLPVEGQRSSVQEQWLSNAKLFALGWKVQETLSEAIREQLDAERARA
jgi:GDP-4-dehydro-6-deoxy-D-mannose reductase